MKIATWNVNGIRARQGQLREWIELEKPDVLCLQEIKASPAQVPATLCEMEGYWCYWHGSGGYSGVGLHVRKETFPERPEFSHPPFDHETRVVVARLPQARQSPASGTGEAQPPGFAGPLAVASVYVPNGGKDFPAKMRFLSALEGYAAQMRDAAVALVLCGDLNVARTDADVHPKERKPGLIGQRPEERQLLESVLDQGLVDVGRALDPDNDQMFTWWAPWRNLRQRNIGWRLDYVLASQELAHHASECRVRKDVGTSDHAPVVATFL